jgi:hypothetical protein
VPSTHGSIIKQAQSAPAFLQGIAIKASQVTRPVPLAPGLAEVRLGV